jgi:large subunit ribosomal protein L2
MGRTKPEKSLTTFLPKKSGRGMYGRITTRHRGGRHRRKLRIVDFRRDKKDIPAKVVAIEYDPNRTVDIALLNYSDGEKRYILAPVDLKVGDEVISGEKVEIRAGNAMPLEQIPVGSFVHNIELIAGKGGQVGRSAGSAAQILAKEKDFVHLKLPSGEARKINRKCFATIGQLGKAELRTIKLGKAGRKRWKGFRPAVRGVAMEPSSHPHGGGEGRSGIGMPSPKTPWGKKTLGKKTRKKRLSDKYIIKRRK